MKRHERRRIGGSFGAGELPLLSSFLHLSDESEAGLTAHLRFQGPLSEGRSESKSVSGGEFGCVATNGHSGIGGCWCLTPLAPYEKSKFLGSGGSMVTRLKL